MGTSSEIKALTGLRGVGAVWVFLFHLLGSYHVPGIQSGELAVPMFFVLSGFILFFVHQTDFQYQPNRRTLHAFFASRFARVYPLHLFALSVLLVLVVLLPGFIERYPSQKFSIPNFFATILLIQTWGIGHFPVFKEASSAWNVPAWSLSAEIFYYVLFPWAALVLFKGGKQGFALPQMLLCALLVIAAYGGLQGTPSYTRSLVCGWFAFLFGMSVCVFAQQNPKLPTAILEFTALLLILLKLIFIDMNTGIFIVGVAALIISLKRNNGYLIKIFSSGVIYFLGKISFSIYVLHWPIIQFLNYIQSQGMTTETITLHLSRILLIPLVLLLSYITFIKIELPARSYLRRLILKL